jgi:hypothetical protein
VIRIDRNPEGGITVFFADGAKFHDDRTFEEAEKLVQKYWRLKA